MQVGKQSTTTFRGKQYHYWDIDNTFYKMMESDEQTLRNRFLKPNTMLDVGAYMGSWTIPAALIGAQVIAMEPNNNYLTLLKSNLEINHLNAQLISIAAWNENCYLTFDGWECNKGGQLVHGRRIDALGLPHIDFIKIDVEGSEMQVLEGAQGIIERDHPEILVECNNDYTVNTILSLYGGERIDGNQQGGHVYITPSV